jgi:hypothetical protein
VTLDATKLSAICRTCKITTLLNDIAMLLRPRECRNFIGKLAFILNSDPLRLRSPYSLTLLLTYFRLFFFGLGPIATMSSKYCVGCIMKLPLSCFLKDALASATSRVYATCRQYHDRMNVSHKKRAILQSLIRISNLQILSAVRKHVCNLQFRYKTAVS